MEIGISSAEGGLGFVSLKIFDGLGREVQTLVNEKLSPGKYNLDFSGSNFASGVYYYRLTSGNFFQVRKMILLK